MSKTDNATRKGRILEVRIVRRIEEGGNTDYLGEYTDAPRPEDFDRAIDREERGDMGLTQMRYFVPGNDNANPESWAHVSDADVSKAWLTLPEDVRMRHPEATTREAKIAVVGKIYNEQDYRRAENYNAGNWCFLNIFASASVTLPGCDVVQTITSGGEGGVESDSGEKYLAGIESEQLAELRENLSAIGFGERAIDEAFGRVERKGND